MPELPEVETVVRGLRQIILNKTIAKVLLKAPPSTIVLSNSFKSTSFDKIIKSKKILNIYRRGKNILISLSGNITLWVHLKMTGHFNYVTASLPVDKHDLVIFNFKSTDSKMTNNQLRFNDYRRFGRLRLFYDGELSQQKGLHDLGPEPLEISLDTFVNLFKSTRRMIKPALLDQTFIAGLGNIYADESLYLAKIHPKKLTSSLSKRKLNRLHYHIQKILQMAINKMGTSVDSFTGVNGKPGQFQNYLKVYRNEGNLCQICEKKIVRIKIGSRSAHFCPRCQRL